MDNHLLARATSCVGYLASNRLTTNYNGGFVPAKSSESLQLATCENRSTERDTSLRRRGTRAEPVARPSHRNGLRSG